MLLGRNTGGFLYVFDTPVRLLVVDDDPVMRELASNQLDHPGGEIVTAQDGEEALEILEADQRFDLVLSDLEMPRMNGFALLDAIRRHPRLAHLPVVVVTSRDDVFAIDRAYELGATSFAAKPVNWRLVGYQLRYVLRSARMEQAMREAHAAADRADRLKESLLALLQHETRTPLNAIIGYSELLQATLNAETDPRSYVETLLEAARGLNSTLARVFYFAQLSAETLALDRETLPAGELAEQVLRRHRLAAQAAGVTLTCLVESEAVVDVDQRHLGTALAELVGNALGHAPAGSTVSITVTREGDGCVAITVADTGAGLDAEALARCGEPFWQGEPALVRRSGGLGLGLPTARRIADLHGGRLAVASSPGEGLRASLVLPAVAVATAQEKAA